MHRRNCICGSEVGGSVRECDTIVDEGADDARCRLVLEAQASHSAKFALPLELCAAKRTKKSGAGAASTASTRGQMSLTLMPPAPAQLDVEARDDERLNAAGACAV